MASATGSHGEPLNKLALLLLVFMLVSNHFLKAMKLIHPVVIPKGVWGKWTLISCIGSNYGEVMDKLCWTLLRSFIVLSQSVVFKLSVPTTV